MPGPVDIGDVVAGLTARAEDLAREVLPKGRRQGGEWVEARTAAGGLGDSLTVRISGAKAGLWMHGAAAQSGDALDLVAYVLFGDDKARALQWAKSWLGLDGQSPGRLEQTRRQAAASAKRADEDETRRRESAIRLFLGCRESLKGTPVEAYLLGRGIDLAALGRQPRALRFHPGLDNLESGRAWPALVAAINRGDGRTCAVHRTWLEIHGDGSATKAPLENPKMTLGTYTGGSVRVWRGASGKSLKNVTAGETLAITEGIEDALTIAMARPEIRVLSAVSLANMAHVELPPAVQSVMLVADNDAPGSPAAEGLKRAIAAHQEAGRKVLIARPPAGAKDMNEIIRRVG